MEAGKGMELQLSMLLKFMFGKRDMFYIIKNSMNILFHHLFEINKKLPKELQGLSTSLEKEDKL